MPPACWSCSATPGGLLPVRGRWLSGRSSPGRTRPSGRKGCWLHSSLLLLVSAGLSHCAGSAHCEEHVRRAHAAQGSGARPCASRDSAFSGRRPHRRPQMQDGSACAVLHCQAPRRRRTRADGVLCQHAAARSRTQRVRQAACLLLQPVRRGCGEGMREPSGATKAPMQVRCRCRRCGMGKPT
jgi:hypothetical protein